MSPARSIDCQRTSPVGCMREAEKYADSLTASRKGELLPE
jgi:hypothetical protein